MLHLANTRDNGRAGGPRFPIPSAPCASQAVAGRCGCGCVLVPLLPVLPDITGARAGPELGGLVLAACMAQGTEEGEERGKGGEGVSATS